jgi:transposase
LAEAGLRREVREHGKILNTPAALKALTMKLAPARRELRFCYEAGPCGYGIQRQLTEAGHECAVVAPWQASGSRPTGGMRLTLPSSTAPVN